MYTNQVSNFVQRLLSAGMPEAQAQIIAEFGNCSGPLDHRAPVSISNTPSQNRGSLGGAAPWDVDTITAGGTAPYSTLRVSNWDSQLSDDRDTVTGGLTQIINGGLYVDFIVGPPGGEPIDTSQIVTVTVLSNIRYDTASHKWQKKTRDIKVLESSAESDWIDVHTAELLAKVVREATYDVDVTDTFVNHHTENVYVLEAGDTGTDNVFDTEPC